MKAKIWNAYLPIPSSSTSDSPPETDDSWLLSRGVEPRALPLLRLVRTDLLPLVRELQRKRLLESFSFLVHDRSSGVPCPPDDHAAYLHFRPVFKNAVDAKKILPKKWIMVTPVKQTVKEERAHQFLNPQSAWYLDFVEAHKNLDDRELLQEIRQHLHFYNNMAQMRTS